MIYKTDKQQGYTVQHREFYPVPYHKIQWNITCKYSESLCCIPDTNTIL